MNKNNCSNSASTSQSQVISKYFSNESNLDESLKEFQEKKKNVAGPKNTCKNANKKKHGKCIKGQKDIRSLIQEKNDLLAYSKDFNNICKQSGVDIDAEQLQLAIALSKSLQDSKQSISDINITKPLTAQERTNKIRTTLQEYGFKVPEVKNPERNKKIRKRRKKYKLLLTTNSEKQQIILEKYSQILSSNFNNYHVEATNIEIPKESIYYKSTSIYYEDMKNYDTFYVNCLIEKTFTSMNLLRDWSEIPGRCCSPVFEGPSIGFNDISCSQDELDILMSGCLVSSRALIQRKLNNYANQTETLSVYKSNSVIKTDIHKIDESTMARNILSDETQLQSMSMKVNNVDKNKIERIEDTAHNIQKENCIVKETLSQPLILTEYLKSNCECHQSVAEDNSKSLSQILNGFAQRSQSPDLFDDDVSSIIDVSIEVSKTLPASVDLTQCVPTHLQPQVSNTTKRLSKDVVELTGCVSNVLKDNDMVDLTQTYNAGGITIIYEDLVNVSCNNNKDSEEIMKLDENSIIITEINNICEDLDKSTTETLKDPTFQRQESFDLTKSSDSYSSLPDIKISGTSKVISLGNINDNRNHSLYGSAIEAPYYNDINTSISKIDEISFKNTKFETFSASEVFKNNDYIDLTQSDSVVNKNLSNNDKLGKIDDTSIDYDEMFDDVIGNHSNTSKSTDKSITYDLAGLSKQASASRNEASTSNSERFELTDQELNYSIINDNMLENFDVYRDYDDELPSIDMNSRKHLANYEVVTPIKVKNCDVIKTPSNNEYIIKTAEVTPMQNFEAMSSPECNKELEKYGLKPLKRKRAIQLLTYIYDQTHPVVESCEDVSPSKRLKRSSMENNISPSPRKDGSLINTLKSPRKLNESPKKSQKSPRMSSSPKESDKDPITYLNKSDKENIYVQTTDLPIIKDIFCDPVDWVFQKREKAKVHSCRVPLHIAFHNYVSCRRLLRQAILCYEPINIDIVHKDLVAAGYRYNPTDLLKFMDKKCITVKTVDNKARNKK